MSNRRKKGKTGIEEDLRAELLEFMRRISNGETVKVGDALNFVKRLIQ